MPLAHAACTNPAAGEGALIYNGDQHVMQYCSGTIWIGMAGGVASGFTETDPKVGTLTSNKWCTSNAGGTAIICNQNAPSGAASNGATGLVQFSDGAGGFLSDATVGGELFWDATNHRLGIGTAVPSNELHVVSAMAGAKAAQFEVTGTHDPTTIGMAGIMLTNRDSTTSSLWGLTFSSYDTTDVGRHASAIAAGKESDWAGGSGNYAGYLSFWTRPTGGEDIERLRITSTGNVGIGTTTPASKLDVAGGARVGADAVCSVGKAGMLAWNSNTLQLCTDAGTFTNIASASGGSSQWSNGTSGAIYYNGGNVGIGTAAPYDKLHVHGGRALIQNGSFNDTIGNKAWLHLATDDWIAGNYTSSPAISLYVDTLGTAGLAFHTYTGSAQAQRMTITAAGNVGIGTTTPGYKLDVAGDANFSDRGGFGILPASSGAQLGVAPAASTRDGIIVFTSDSSYSGDMIEARYGTTPLTGNLLKLAINNGADTKFIVTGAGNVGIGTAAPSAGKLVVTQTTAGSTGGDDGVVSTLTPTGDGESQFAALGSTGNLRIAAQSAAGSFNPLVLANDARITFSNGSVDTGGLVLAPHSSSAKGIRIDGPTGNVGIGTATPQSKLDVAGGARVGADAVCSAAKAGMLVWNANTLQVCTDAGSFTNIASSSVGANQWSNGASGAIYYNGGNVGIGTTAPALRLHVSDGAQFYGVTAGASPSGVDYAYPYETVGVAPGMNLRLESPASIVFHTGMTASEPDDNSKARMIIGPTGNVGIGTISPLTKLHLALGAGTDVMFNQLSSYNYISLNGLSNNANYFTTGNIGIIGGNGSDPILYVDATAPTGAIKFRTNGNNVRATIDAGGNVGIGTTSPQSPLHLTGASGAGEALRISNGVGSEGGQISLMDGTGAGGWEIDNSGTGASALFRIFRDKGVNNVTGLIIAPTGNVGIGTTSPTQKLDVSTGNIQLGDNRAVSALNVGTFGHKIGREPSDGSLYIGGGQATVRILNNLVVAGTGTTCTIGSGTGATNCTSDERLKTDIKPIEGALDKLSAIKGVTFEWKDKNRVKGPHLGVIAQDVEKVFPQAVTEVDDKTLGKAKAVDYAVLVAPLIESVKELKAANDNQSSAIEELRRELRALKASR